MIRAGLRRVVVILVVVLGATAAVSAALGALAGKNIHHALAIGFYVVGVAVLFGSFAFGSRGPTRVDRGGEEDRPLGPSPTRPLRPFGFGRRPRRKATLEERSEARWASLGLFAFGVLIVFLGVLLDPARHVF